MGTGSAEGELVGLNLFHGMYVVGLALGLEEITTSLYQALERGALTFASVFLFFSILLLIVRFFWSTGNIRRAWMRDAHPNPKFYILVHLPALLIQGSLVLFVCLAYAKYLSGAVSGTHVVVWFIVATSWNIFWLLLLTKGKVSQPPEYLWAKNNVILVLVGIGILAIGAAMRDYQAMFIIAFSLASLVSSAIDLAASGEEYLATLGC